MPEPPKKNRSPVEPLSSRPTEVLPSGRTSKPIKSAVRPTGNGVHDRVTAASGESQFGGKAGSKANPRSAKELPPSQQRTEVAPQPTRKPAPAAHDAPQTRPGGPYGSGALSPLTEVMSLIGDKRPDLVEFLVNLERNTKEKMKVAVKAEVQAQEERINTMFARFEELVRTELSSGQRLGELISRSEGDLGSLMQAIDHERQDMLAEAKAVNTNYKQLMDKLVAERDALVVELKEARARAAADGKSYSETVAKLRQTSDRERRDAEERLRVADRHIKELKGRVRELEGQVQETLDSRDRIAERVRKVESKLDAAVLPVREDLENARVREEKLRSDLDQARKEIATLKLLAKPPP